MRPPWRMATMKPSAIRCNDRDNQRAASRFSRHPAKPDTGRVKRGNGRKPEIERRTRRRRTKRL
ncbi:hypothetical protein CV_1193 [Chromobacterium violaceum ATCC 12472]|uniref:Uncharacterized protein n=1 Tax=Chromobacterium violaceum (strain ATCC 12472 / DSM 30191 / JCM 1249 / CCUG 213 / NBRC 12614 / NCIMB 9131 / NCTC 9757 / MK) TaxID=243365 RepID=Q7NYS9_CHRVO|nr:hypothetical protein CV_1193 [Chromobacterium violaceum ATCC 12472]